MAAPRKTQHTSTDSSDTTSQPDEVTTEQTSAPATSTEQTAVIETTDGEQHTGELPASAIVEEPSGTEQVTLEKDAGGHRAGDTITVTHGAADFLREQGYVADHDEDDA